MKPIEKVLNSYKEGSRRLSLREISQEEIEKYVYRLENLEKLTFYKVDKMLSEIIKSKEELVNFTLQLGGILNINVDNVMKRFKKDILKK